MKNIISQFVLLLLLLEAVENNFGKELSNEDVEFLAPQGEQQLNCQ